jgi:quinol monooxygenase YgiN
MRAIVQHTCADYEAWRPVFDEHASARKDHGCLSERVYRDADDPNQVAVIMEWSSQAAAEGFMADASLRDAMERGGVVGPPTVTFGESAPHPAF